MICHVVLIRLKPALREEEVDAFLQRARDLLGPIPGVHNLHVGRTVREDATHPLALVMEFDDQATLAAYQVHPEHQSFLADIIGPIIEDKLILDYEAP